MRKMMKVTALLLALCTLVLCGCSNAGDNTQTSEKTYSISVVDDAGNPCTSGVIVEFLQNGTQAAMQPIGSDGTAQKTLPAGEYTVNLKFTDTEASYYYDPANLKLSAEKTQLQIQLFHMADSTAVEVYDSNGQTNAYGVTAGSTYVKLTDGARNYFLFVPRAAGTYRFTTSDSKAVIGNYGYTSYIQANSISKVEENAFTMSITASMVGSGEGANPYVIGVDANGITECILTIERIGDPAYSIEENEAWVVYEPTVELKKFTTPEGTIKEFDLTAATDAYVLVFNEEDKTYHLNTADGPQVLVQLSKPTKYLDAISNICTTAGVAKYFYDADGNFVKRENYTKCLQIYSCDKIYDESDRVQSAGTEIYLDQTTGLYPLTEDLKYIIQNHGEYAGWWDINDPGYLFEDADGNNMIVGLNPDIAWLFLCCYVEQ